eukprot:6122536-Prymnesium_polylepis.1
MLADLTTGSIEDRVNLAVRQLRIPDIYHDDAFKLVELADRFRNKDDLTAWIKQGQLRGQDDCRRLSEHLDKIDPRGPGVLEVTAFMWGVGDRCRPAVRIMAVVERRPQFYVINLMLPILSFVILTSFQWAVPARNTEERLAISLTLVLTAAAYKSSASAMLPAINYLTLLDRYIAGCFGIMFLAAFEGGVLGLVYKQFVDADAPDVKVIEVIDVVLFFVHGALIIFLNAWYFRKMWRPKSNWVNERNLIVGGLSRKDVVSNGYWQRSRRRRGSFDKKTLGLRQSGSGESAENGITMRHSSDRKHSGSSEPVALGVLREEE